MRYLCVCESFELKINVVVKSYKQNKNFESNHVAKPKKYRIKTGMLENFHRYLI